MGQPWINQPGEILYSGFYIIPIYATVPNLLELIQTQFSPGGKARQDAQQHCVHVRRPKLLA